MRIYTWVTRDGRLCWATKVLVSTYVCMSRGAFSHEKVDAEPWGEWVTVHTKWTHWTHAQTEFLGRAMLANFGGGAA